MEKARLALRRRGRWLALAPALLLWGASVRAEGEAAAAAEAAGPPTGAVEVLVRGARTDEGVVAIQLAVSKEDYEEGLGLHELARAPIEGGESSWRFEGIPYGSYALRIFHDANANGELDTNFMGIPKEMFAFSNNAMGRFGPASWEDARFELDAPVVRQEVELEKVGR